MEKNHFRGQQPYYHHHRGSLQSFQPWDDNQYNDRYKSPWPNRNNSNYLEESVEASNYGILGETLPHTHGILGDKPFGTPGILGDGPPPKYGILGDNPSSAFYQNADIYYANDNTRYSHDYFSESENGSIHHSSPPHRTHTYDDSVYEYNRYDEARNSNKYMPSIASSNTVNSSYHGKRISHSPPSRTNRNSISHPSVNSHHSYSRMLCKPSSVPSELNNSHSEHDSHLEYHSNHHREPEIRKRESHIRSQRFHTSSPVPAKMNSNHSRYDRHLKNDSHHHFKSEIRERELPNRPQRLPMSSSVPSKRDKSYSGHDSNHLEPETREQETHNRPQRLPKSSSVPSKKDKSYSRHDSNHLEPETREQETHSRPQRPYTSSSVPSKINNSYSKQNSNHHLEPKIRKPESRNQSQKHSHKKDPPINSSSHQRSPIRSSKSTPSSKEKCQLRQEMRKRKTSSNESHVSPRKIAKEAKSGNGHNTPQGTKKQHSILPSSSRKQIKSDCENGSKNGTHCIKKVALVSPVSLQQREKSIQMMLESLYSQSATKNTPQINITHPVNNVADGKLVETKNRDKKDVTENQDDIIMTCERKQSEVIISATKPFLQKKIERNIKTESILKVQKHKNETSFKNEIHSKEVINVQISSLKNRDEGEVHINSSREIKSSCSTNVWNFSNSGSPMKVSEEKSESQSISVTNYINQVEGDKAEEIVSKSTEGHCRVPSTESSNSSQVSNIPNSSDRVTRSKISVLNAGLNPNTYSEQSLNSNKVQSTGVAKDKIDDTLTSNKSVTPLQSTEITLHHSPPTSENRQKEAVAAVNTFSTRMPHKDLVTTQKLMTCNLSKMKKSSKNCNSKVINSNLSGVNSSHQMSAKSKKFTSKTKKVSCKHSIQRAKNNIFIPKSDSASTSKRNKNPQPTRYIKKKKKKPFRGGRYQLFLHGRPKKKIKKLSSTDASSEKEVRNKARKSSSTGSTCALFPLQDSPNQVSGSMELEKSPNTVSDAGTIMCLNSLILNDSVPKCRKTVQYNSTPCLLRNGSSIDCIASSTFITKKPSVAKKSLSGSSSYFSSKEDVSEGGVTQKISMASTSWQSSIKKGNDGGVQTNYSVSSQQFSSTTWTAQKFQFICSCLVAPHRGRDFPLEETMCQAIDSIDGQNVGCTQITSQVVFARPSIKLDPIEMCQLHILRLRCHQCCPICGTFCTQGSFLRCKPVANNSQPHFFHKICMKRRTSCPHCGKASCIESIRLQMAEDAFKNRSRALTSHLLSQKILKKSPATVPVSSLYGNDAGHNSCSNLVPYSESSSRTFTKVMKRNPSSFHAAIRQGETTKVHLYIENGMDVNYKFEIDANNTPLHIASKMGHLDIVKFLLQFETCLDSFNDNLETPLLLASKKNHLYIVQCLLQRNASVVWADINQMTCLHVAAKAGNIEICELLCGTGKVHMNAKDQGGRTPLVWACERKRSKTVKLLLEHGANPLVMDNDGNMAVHWTAFTGDLDTCKLLLNFCSVDSVNRHGDTPAHIAVRKNNYRCVNMLMEKGANAELKNGKGLTPLMVCENPDSKIYQKLKWYQEAKHITKKLIIKNNCLLYPDIAGGREFCPIPVINDHNNDQFEKKFRYIKEFAESASVFIDKSVNNMQFCNCLTCSKNSCSCQSQYDINGRFIFGFDLYTTEFFECNKLCSCQFSCHNKVVQHGIRVPLQVFKTSLKGWGVRSIINLQRGTFVCQYIGELLTLDEAMAREEDSYIFQFDGKSNFCIDSFKFGNVSRYINHSCTPNLVPIKTFTEHCDSRFPNVAFFACKDIEAKEELTFDYCKTFWNPKFFKKICHCESISCRFGATKVDEELKETLDPEAQKILKSEHDEMKDSESGEMQSSESGEMQSSESGEMQDSESGEMQDSESGEMQDSESGEMQDSESGEMQDSESGEMQDSDIGEMDDSDIGEMDDSDIGEIDDSESEKIDDSESEEMQGSESDEMQDTESEEDYTITKSSSS